MDFTEILSYFFYYAVPIILGLVVLYFLGKRLYKTATIRMRIKKYVKQAIKLDKHKFDGEQLVRNIKRKRKRLSNSYQKLRGRAKRKVKRYLVHKAEEIPAFAIYTYGKLYKRSNNKVFIYIKEGKKTREKFPAQKGLKKLIDISNKYQCLDELLIFLHYLPQAIVEKRDYVVAGSMDNIEITFSVK